MDDLADIADAIEEVEIALWFHDAVYKPTSSSNELESAEWASAFLRSVGAKGEGVLRVHQHILATRHAAEALAGDTALMVDVDLSILGRDPPEFQEYEDAICKEYKWVPKPLYRRKRVEILPSFLDRPAIFQTEYFHRRYEAQARENIGWSIQQLRKCRLTKACS